MHLPTILYLVDAPMAIQPVGPQHVFIGAHFQLSPIVELNLALHVAQQNSWSTDSLGLSH